MRAPVVIAALLAGLVAGAAAARAADLQIEPGGESCCHAGYGPAAPLVILDNEPGVVIRRWWLPPWRNRHYYPHGVEKLQTGSREGADESQPRPAPSYARYWTNPPVYVLDASPLLPGEAYSMPMPRPRRYPPPAVAAP